MPKIYYDGKEITGGGSGGAINFKFGKTLVEKDGVIDVAIPTNGLIDQDLYDLLPEEEKKHGAWIVRGSRNIDADSKFPFGNADIYSTEEVRIGTWTDGKPLYRRVFSFTTPSRNTNTIISALTNDIIVQAIYGSVTGSENRAVFQFPFIGNDGGRIHLYFMPEDSQLKVGLNNVTTENLFGASAIAIIEYTKTTDEPDNATQALVSDLKIEEYDTDVDGCQWHVMKWSNGYVEMRGVRWYSKIPVQNEWGNLYGSGVLKALQFPINLTKKYNETIGVMHETSYTSAVFPVFSGVTSINLLESTPNIVVYRGLQDTGANFGLTVNITGRWK